MILQALNNCYQRLRAEPDAPVPPLYYSIAPVSYAFELSPAGQLVAVYPLYSMDGKRKDNPRMVVPERVDRTVNIDANFLCDNAGYVLGYDNKSAQRRPKKFAAFCELHSSILEGVEDTGAQALLAFLQAREAEDVSDSAFNGYREELLEDGNIVFRLAGEAGYLHERRALRQAWEKYRKSGQSEIVAQCLITGEIQPIARTHPDIKGVVGAQSSGASIVSFNDDAYCSYGKEQSFNAPVSEQAAFSYTTALNYLLSSEKHRMRVGDTTTVFWAERTAPREEDIFASLWNMPTEKDIDEGKIDKATVRLLRDTMECLRDGRSIRQLELDPDVHIYILGLAPNAGRLSVRFFQTQTFGVLLDRFNQHYLDMRIVQSARFANYFPPVWRLLSETAVERKASNVPNTLITSTMRAILNGTPYPASLYQAILMRIKAERNINAVRAGVIKAYLLRQARSLKQDEEVYTVALNESNTQQAYLLGRLFALLEKAQLNAQGQKLNKTIRDSYFSSASSTPVVVFPQLLRLAQYHIAKTDSNIWIDRQIAKILDQIPVEDERSASNPWGFPAALSLKEQGLFMLGYYQQRQFLYTPRAEKEKSDLETKEAQ